MALIWGRQSTWVLGEEQKREILKRYEAGASMRSLAKRYGLRSHSAIHSIIRTQRKRRQARA
jgi:Mor family transcriptional regulator